MTSSWNGIRRTMLGAKQSRLLFAAALFATILAGVQAFAQEPQGGPGGRDNQKVKPFKIIGNVYFVGMTDQTVLLIATPEGHILIDTHWERMVPWIRESVEALGFNMRDIKHILNTHSHADHVEGHSLVKELTGAQVVFSEADGAVMAEGGGIWQGRPPALEARATGPPCPHRRHRDARRYYADSSRVSRPHPRRYHLDNGGRGGWPTIQRSLVGRSYGPGAVRQ